VVRKTRHAIARPTITIPSRPVDQIARIAGVVGPSVAGGVVADLMRVAALGFIQKAANAPHTTTRRSCTRQSTGENSPRNKRKTRKKKKKKKKAKKKSLEPALQPAHVLNEEHVCVQAN
jgi:hypothetical protein